MSERTRGQRMMDSIVIGAGGTLAAAIMFGIITGGWSIYTGIHRVEVMQKAMNMVISDQLARVDYTRIDELEAQIKAEREERQDEIGFILMLLEEEGANELEEMIISVRAKKLKLKPDVQEQTHDQNQDVPGNWRKHDDRKRNMQEQVQQQYDRIK